MAYSAHYPYGTYSTDADQFANAVRTALDVAPSDRLGPPRRRPIRKWLTWSAVLIATAGASALHVDDPARWPRWWAEAYAMVAPLYDQVVAPVVARAKLASQQTAKGTAPANVTADAADRGPAALTTGKIGTPPQGAASADVNAPAADAEVVATAEPVEKTIAAAPAVAEVEPETPASKAAAGLRAAAEHPDRARAVAVGLNPDISRVLLARLSDADYRNAGIAITKALTETPDDNVLYWPLKTKPGVAQFQVHFVPGADEGCRRYVVTIAKDGWATTSLPMDKCGVAPRTAAGAK